MKKNKVLFTNWCAKDILNETFILDPLEELAFRRIIDLMYSNNGGLPDDDKRLQHMLKSGKNWPKIKKNLLELQKIQIHDGKIIVQLALDELEETNKRIAQCSSAGKKSAEQRKYLNNLKSHPTGVLTGEHTPVSTNHKSQTTKKNPPYPQSSMKMDICNYLTDAQLQNAKAAAPRWDIYMLMREYNNWVNLSGIEVRDPYSHFYAFILTHTQGKPPT